MKKSTQGGKRKGAGRPKGSGKKEPTVTKRLPKSLLPEVEKLISERTKQSPTLK